MIDIETLINNIDILTFIEQYADCYYKGSEWWCCSPLNKNDTDPSFSINTTKNRFYDFSTDIGGDIVNFVKAYYHCNTYKAIQILLQYTGMTEDDIKAIQPSSILLYLKKINNQNQSKKTTNYVKIPFEYMNRYIFEDNMLQSWYDEGISRESIFKYHITTDKSSNCIIIPIYDNEGNIVNISNRTLYKDYKERKLPKYIYSFGWNDGGIDVLWGVSFKKKSIQKSKRIIIVEGIKSVLKLEEFGYDNSVAILTSHLNDLQLEQLIKLRAKEYIFALDMNVNIREDKNIKKLNHFGKVTFLRDYDGKLGEKDAPCDKGKIIFDKLFETRYNI